MQYKVYRERFGGLSSGKERLLSSAASVVCIDSSLDFLTTCRNSDQDRDKNLMTRCSSSRNGITALLFYGGVMNPYWVVGLAVFVLLE